ncbi:MAG: hypothetical protein ACOYA9_02160 [Bilifractor sp.]|jgi:hypothetical protein
MIWYTSLLDFVYQRLDLCGTQAMQIHRHQILTKENRMPERHAEQFLKGISSSAGGCALRPFPGAPAVFGVIRDYYMHHHRLCQAYFSLFQKKEARRKSGAPLKITLLR